MDAMGLLVDIIRAIDDGKLRMESEEIDGDISVGIPPHPYHEEWIHYARKTIANKDKQTIEEK